MKDFLKIFGISFIAFTLIIGFGAKIYVDSFFDEITEGATAVIIPDEEDYNGIDYDHTNVGNVRYNFLLIGVDDSRADTIMVLSLNIETLELDMISVPRDTYHNRPGYDDPGQKKINAAYAIGGTDQTRSISVAQAVSNLLGIPIHYYIRVDFDAVIRIVDNIGGVTVNITERMYYADPLQDLLIDFQPGIQKLNGKKSLEYLRYRSYSNGDLTRVANQQYFIKEMVKQSLGFSNLVSTIETLTSYTATNMTSNDIKRFAMLASNFDPNKIRSHTVPGTYERLFNIEFLINDFVGTRAIIDSIYARD